jgi:hypothetical protein
MITIMTAVREKFLSRAASVLYRKNWQEYDRIYAVTGILVGEDSNQ